MKFTQDEMTEWEKKYNYSFWNKNPLVIANNSTGYSYDNTAFSTNAVLYWSEKDSCIYGIVYKENQRGGGMGGDRWYEVEVLFHEPIKSKSKLRDFNKSKGKSVGSSSAGWAWKKKWEVPHRVKDAMTLSGIYVNANFNPYAFLGISESQMEWGIVNQHKM